MNNFDKALKIVLDFEGGYVNDPADPGGATMFGITQRVYDEFLRNYGEFKWSIKDISREAVESIYYDQYWTPAGCDKLPPGLDVFHFDTAVNCGVGTAGKMLQNAVNQNSYLRTGKELVIDGAVGPLTLMRISELPINRIVKFYTTLRKNHYECLIEKNQDLEKFRKGWMGRVDRLAEMCW